MSKSKLFAKYLGADFEFDDEEKEVIIKEIVWMLRDEGQTEEDISEFFSRLIKKYRERGRRPEIVDGDGKVILQ